ncbi:hypothetical protein [Atopobium fossor]|uniref:hypothetical protein n=1 Tax=Atopobium fossor TaxID=39487 RepID=UPI00040B7745|nr:hypothetical protein [Atopobium fossor]
MPNHTSIPHYVTNSEDYAIYRIAELQDEVALLKEENEHLHDMLPPAHPASARRFKEELCKLGKQEYINNNFYSWILEDAECARKDGFESWAENACKNIPSYISFDVMLSMLSDVLHPMWEELVSDDE